MSINGVFEKINKQNSIENLYCVGNIENEEQLNNLKKEGYLVDYTKESWEKEYPSIPVKYIYCMKCEIVPSSLMYLDMEHGIFFATYIYGKQVLSLPKNRSFEDYLNMLIKEKMDEYQNKNYSRLLHTNMLSEQGGPLLITLLSHLLEKEEPCGELYEAFFSVYTFVDRGIENLSPKAREKLWACKSQSQKEKTQKRLEEFGDQITVYRGQGSKSTPEDAAMSWTTDKDTALFFASRFFDGESVLLEGIVPKSAVMEYELGRDEWEVIVEPKQVTVTSRRYLMNLDESCDYIYEIQDYIYNHKDARDYKKKYNFNKTLHRVLSLYERNGRMSRDHDARHSCRVVLLANILYMMNTRQNTQYTSEGIFQDFKRVIDAAIYHDIGRIGELADSEHGKASYQIYRKENGDSPVVKFLIENHCIEDEEARKRLEKEFPEEKRERIFQLLGILKDADALDRVRFGYGSCDYLKVKYLHNEDAFRLIGIAGWLDTQSFEVWR